VNKGGVRVQRRYDATLDELWSALTEPESVSRWLGEHGMSGHVTAMDPPRLIELEWQLPGEPVSRVRFELHEEEDGVRLVVDHRGLDRAASTAYGEGWKAHLGELAAVIEEGAST
jgi:uncharacterized protein YndB with AHSA1/START domain